MLQFISIGEIFYQEAEIEYVPNEPIVAQLFDLQEVAMHLAVINLACVLATCRVKHLAGSYLMPVWSILMMLSYFSCWKMQEQNL